MFKVGYKIVGVFKFVFYCFLWNLFDVSFKVSLDSFNEFNIFYYCFWCKL